VSLGDAALTFLSVFIAALLAFYLDGLRARRATRAWVAEYLGFWRGLLDSTAGEGEANEAGVRKVESALDGWLAAGPGVTPAWDDIDAININATVRFTPALLNTGASVVPPDLMRSLFVVDALAPAMTTRSEFVERLFEVEVRPLVLGQVVPLEGRDRRVVELYRREFLGLFDQMRDYTTQLGSVREELGRLGF
jgi:hypothetical protein